jgi:4-alpha-glucanotransferase
MTPLERLARDAGIAQKWTDASGKPQTVTRDVLCTLLSALGYPAASARQITDSHARLEAERNQPLPLQVVGTRASFAVHGKRQKYMRVSAEDGSKIDLHISDGKAKAPETPGYYRLADGQTRLAVVPDRAYAQSKKIWGISSQLYALRGGTAGGFGDFSALAGFARDAGAAGADAVAISPVHALFGAIPDHISPYSPSTRLFLNPLYAAAPMRQGDSNARQINWPAAAARKIVALRQLYARHGKDEARDAFIRKGGERLLGHARFEVLDKRFRAAGHCSWRAWPAPFGDAASLAVKSLTAADPEIAFQLFLQWQADAGLAAAQAAARAAGMVVGLITDMAVGMDPAGSHAWSAPGEVLRGLSIGAPPDIYNTAGQNWGLTNFSPQGLRLGGFEGFIGTLRAAMRHAGGIRLDHAMGLVRLWVIPDGAKPGEGAYLHYPTDEMLGLLALESQRHRAIVIAEDLGTVPDGFRARIARARLLGMRVLWFERDCNGGFLPPNDWDACAAALSTTHDLPTLAGWWQGRDLVWRSRIGGDRKTLAAETKTRAKDRKLLWQTLRKTGCAAGAIPRPGAPGGFADAAFKSLAKTPCPVALLTVEDFIGEAEQPNIPGTVDEHPNWRRRLKSAHPLATRAARRRAALLNAARP